MTRTRPFAELRTETNGDPVRRARIEEYKRAIDDSLALARLRDRVESPPSGDEVLNLSDTDGPRGDRDDDIYLSTLQGNVADLGGRLVVEAVFPGLRVNLLRPTSSSLGDEGDDALPTADGVDDLDLVAGRQDG